MLSPGFRIAVPATLLLHGALVVVLASIPPRAAAPAAQATRVEIEIVSSDPLLPSAGGGLGRGQTLRAAAPAGRLRVRVKGRRQTVRAATPAAPLPNPPPADGGRGPEKTGGGERGSEPARSGDELFHPGDELVHPGDELARSADELVHPGGGPAAAALGLAAAAAPVLAAVGPSTSPHYRSHPPPLYPRSSLRRHEQGTAFLLVTIGAEGRALAVSIAKSSGYAALDQAAVDAVSDWTFDPARAGGSVAASQALVSVRFAMSAR